MSVNMLDFDRRIRVPDLTAVSKGLIIGLALTMLQACSPPAEKSSPAENDSREEALLVFTVNYPLAYFAERIGGDAVNVHLPTPRGVDPATWSPDAETIVAYQQADLILLNGAAYAAWVSRASLPPSRTLNTSAGFSDRLIVIESAVTHTHGPEGEHAHGDVAFTTWLDPGLALLQAVAIRDELIRRRPDQEEAFRRQFESLAADLAALDDGLQAVFAMLGTKPLLFSHPVYQYLDRRYELVSRSLHWEPNQLLAVAEIDELNDVRTSHPASIIVWEAEPDAETRRRLESLGVESTVFDPCANRPENGDYLGCMRQNLSNMEALL